MKCEIHGVKKIEMWVSKHGEGSDDRSVLQSYFRRVQKVQNKAPIRAKFKTKDGAVFSHIQSCNSSPFQSQLFLVCRCSSPVYFHTN